MGLEIPAQILAEIHAHGESAYPDEGAGLLLGTADKNSRRVAAILPLDNAREKADRHNRYLITPQDMLFAENTAASQGWAVIGVFHSHPDHPERPSDFDREWALPWFTYLITSVNSGKATQSRAWRLTDDRERFEEESIQVPPALTR
jgi:proteasome lid subunit RPN8/RPN11